MRTKTKGSISVFFATCYLLVMMTILAFVENARLKAESVCLQTAVSGAGDCLFGNYCKELYEEYGLLFFDGGYGGDMLLPEKINQEWSSYLLCYGQSPDALGLFPFELSDTSLTDLETAVDRNGEAFLEEIYELEKYEGSMELYDRIGHIFTATEQTGLLPDHLSITGLLLGEGVTELPGISSAEAGIVPKKSVLMRSAKSSADSGNSSFHLRDLFLELGSSSILLMAVDPFYWKVNVKSVQIENSPAVYAPGSQTLEGFTGIENFYEMSRSYSNTEEQYKRLFFLNYMKNHFRSRMDAGRADRAVELSSGDVLPAYEMEYILFGYQNDRLNYIASLETLAAIRGFCNVVSLLADSERMKQIHDFAEEIASGGTELTVAAVTAELVLLWSITESYVDIRALLKNEKVSVFKTHDTWKTDFTDLPDIVSTLTMEGWEGLRSSLFGEKAASLTDQSVSSPGLPSGELILSDGYSSDSSGYGKIAGELPDPDIIDLPDDAWKVVDSEEIGGMGSETGKQVVLPDIKMNYEEYLLLAGMVLDLSSMGYRMMAVMQGHVGERCPGFRMEHMTYSMSFEAEVTMVPVFLPIKDSKKRFGIYSRKLRLTDMRTY